jgi:hypothetical protein
MGVEEDARRKLKEDVKRKLDAVVGDEYKPPRRWGATFGKWLGAAILAVGAAAAVMGILHQQLMQAQTAPAPPAPPKPVTIQIVPAK